MHTATTNIPSTHNPHPTPQTPCHENTYTPLLYRLEPQPELLLHNQAAISIAQSQLPPDPPRFLSAQSTSQTVNATVFPVWAAGLTGAGMVVGIGDSGVGTWRAAGGVVGSR